MTTRDLPHVNDSLHERALELTTQEMTSERMRAVRDLAKRAEVPLEIVLAAYARHVQKLMATEQQEHSQRNHAANRAMINFNVDQPPKGTPAEAVPVELPLRLISGDQTLIEVQPGESCEVVARTGCQKFLLRELHVDLPSTWRIDSLRIGNREQLYAQDRFGGTKELEVYGNTFNHVVAEGLVIEAAMRGMDIRVVATNTNTVPQRFVARLAGTGVYAPGAAA